MNRKSEPTFSDLRPSADDIALRQKQLQAKQRSTNSTASGNGDVAEPSVRGSSAPVFLWVLVLGLGLALGGLVVQFFSLQKSFAAAELRIKAQAENIDILNEKLSVTGENANMSVDALKALVKGHDSEIRKLWGVAYDRNRNNITANAEGLAALKKSLTGTQSTLISQQSKLDAETQRLNTQNTQLNRLESRIKAVAEIELRMAQQAETIQQNQKSINQLQKSTLAKEVAGLKQELNQLKAKVNAPAQP